MPKLLSLEMERLVRWVLQRPTPAALAVVLFWVALVGASVPYALRLFDSTTLDFLSTPDDTDTARAQAVLAAEFDGVVDLLPLVLLVRAPDNASALTPAVRNFTLALADRLRGSAFAAGLHDLQAYYLLADTLPLVAQQLVREEGRATLVVVSYGPLDDMDARRPFVDFLVDSVDRLAPLAAPATVQLTSVDLLVRDSMSALATDLISVDAVALPLAVAILAYVLRTARLLVVPLVTIATSVVTSFALLMLISPAGTVSSFLPDLMVPIIGALCTDYALFQLTRYREQLALPGLTGGGEGGPDTYAERVLAALGLAGHNIVVSGTTIALAFFGLSFFPVMIISSIGRGATLAVVMAMLSNLTLVPALLYLFGGFFRRRTPVPCLRGRCSEGDAERGEALHLNAPREEAKGLLADADAAAVHVPTADKAEHGVATRLFAQRRSVWYRLAVVTQDHPLLVIAAVLALGAPALVLALHFRVSFDVQLWAPHKGAHVEAYRDVMDTFGRSTAMPYFLLAQAHAPNGVLTKSFFNATLDAVRSVGAATSQPLSAFSGPPIVAGLPLTLPIALGYLDPANTDEPAPSYRYLFARTVSPGTNSSCLVGITTTFDPTGRQASTFISTARATLAEVQQRHPNVTFLLAGVPAGQYDLMSEVNRKFPIWVGLTFGMIFLVIAVSFRSLVIPLRLLLTVGYTLAWSYGAAVLVFQSGLFDFIPALRGIDGLCWDVPVVAFFMVSALALDYDVFLLTSVVEHRRRGYTDRAAVVKSVHATGKIISYAGVIMAVALASLLFSSVANLAMLGVQILVAVLLDTFLVRPVFVPALMAVAEHWTWWPSRPPPGELTEDDFDEDWSGLARE